MENIKVCRICLVMDVKLYDLHKSPLDTYFGLFGETVGVNPLNTMELPPYACFECASLLKKCYLFQIKCLHGQSLLFGIINSAGRIDEQSIKSIDRENLNLQSCLKKVSIQGVSIIETFEESQNEIKFEPVDYEVKPDCEIKEQSYELYEDGFLDSVENVSSDDEPLSLHKFKREKRSRTNTDTKDLNLDFTNVEATDVTEELELLVNPTKKKRGRPRKIDGKKRKTQDKTQRRTANTGGVMDDGLPLEEYVNIIKLTLEEQMEEVNKRKFSSNYQNSPYKCNLCYKGFVDTDAWKHHLGKHDPRVGDLECPVCKFRFKTKRIFQKHVVNHNTKYACKSCNYVSKTTTQAKQHHGWHKGVTYKCQYCDDVSTKWTSYLSHVRMKHPSEFICGICGYSFVSKLGLAMHKSMMHKDVLENNEDPNTNESGPYCQECDVKFISVEAYKRHMVNSAKHSQNNDFTTGCRECGEKFKNAEELRLHHRKEHAVKRPRNYRKKQSNMTWPANCEHCSEVMANAREYWAHFRRMHPDKNYPIQRDHVCDICGKSFRGNAFLIYHKRTHFEERAYKCQKCPKAFFNRTNLQLHEKTHSDSRPYPCNVCFKAFKSKGALDRHYRSHTGEKPYDCEVCGKGFAQSNTRKLHVRTVHLKQPAPYVSKSRQERRRQTSQQPNLQSQQTNSQNIYLFN